MTGPLTRTLLEQLMSAYTTSLCFNVAQTLHMMETLTEKLDKVIVTEHHLKMIVKG